MSDNVLAVGDAVFIDNGVLYPEDWEVHGYSKLDAYNSLRDLERWSYDTFEDSLLGRVDFAEFYLKVDSTVPKAPEPEQVILPDNRMWLP